MYRYVIPLSGGYGGRVPPLPIPNREVKPACADGTAMQCGRVGSRLFSNRSLQDRKCLGGFFDIRPIGPIGLIRLIRLIGLIRLINVSSTNSEQSKLCVNSPLYIDTRLFWEQAIGCNSA